MPPSPNKKQPKQDGPLDGAVACILLIALIWWGVRSIFSYFSGEHKSDYQEFQESSDPAAVITRRCASEAGIPSNDPKHRITPEELRILTECMDRNK